MYTLQFWRQPWRIVYKVSVRSNKTDKSLMKVICVKIKNCLERVLFQLGSAVAIGSWYPQKVAYLIFKVQILHGTSHGWFKMSFIWSDWKYLEIACWVFTAIIFCEAMVSGSPPRNIMKCVCSIWKLEIINLRFLPCWKLRGET